ncbi:MAG TPA: amidohydrolase family protein [Daejeonella sp.]|nr:amidohydrolase family protein [Daejeonella sp.]
MKKFFCIIVSLLMFGNSTNVNAQRVFDVHIHGDSDVSRQISQLKAAGVYKTAVSTSWRLQKSYQSKPGLAILQGLMLACPNGKVPYSNEFCFEDQKDLPDLKWVEEQIQEKKIDFMGEVLSQYDGISSSDKRLFPFYALAEKYGLPVGIHTGLAGPDHGSPNFKVALGSPMLMEEMLQKFPRLKVWIMHSGAPYIEDTLAIMNYYRNVYADISAISNPDIFPSVEFHSIMKRLIDAGLENRLMFGSDNGDISEIIANLNDLDFLSGEQKEKIFYRNAEKLFGK